MRNVSFLAFLHHVVALTHTAFQGWPTQGSCLSWLFGLHDPCYFFPITGDYWRYISFLKIRLPGRLMSQPHTASENRLEKALYLLLALSFSSNISYTLSCWRSEITALFVVHVRGMTNGSVKPRNWKSSSVAKKTFLGPGKSFS